MLVTMKELLDRANEGNYAVAAPNVFTELDARAAIEAAEEQKAPLILDVGFGRVSEINLLVSYLRQMAEQASVPIAINLDHGKTLEQVVFALRAGVTSVMVDRSELPFEENIKKTKELTEFAHAMGVSVEAELGHVGEGVNTGSTVFTDPKNAKRFIEETGVDCLAVSIGSEHGAYVGTPKLQFELLKEIKEVTGNFPLVLHGGSNTGKENLRKACSSGINKVNVCNELMQNACNAVQSADLKGNGAYTLWTVAREGFKAKLKEHIEIYGGKGKAWTPAGKGLAKNPV